jgi:hypothetical protein
MIILIIIIYHKLFGARILILLRQKEKTVATFLVLVDGVHHNSYQCQVLE